MKIVRKMSVLSTTLILFCFVLSMPVTAEQIYESYSEWFEATGGNEQFGDVIESLDQITPSSDGLTFYTNQTVFENAAPGLPNEDFSGTLTPPNSVCSASPPLNSSTNDACFPAGGVMDGFSLDVVFNTGDNNYVVLTPPLLGLPINGVGPNFAANDMDLTFNPPVTAVGFDLLILRGSLTVDIQIFGVGNVLLGQTSAQGSPTGSFLGVTSTTPIERIRTTNGDGELIGNLQFGKLIVIPTMIPTMNEWGIIIFMVLLSVSFLYYLRRLKRV